MKGYWPKNVLEGRMAECLVNELLRRCSIQHEHNKECPQNNKVYRFGYETVLQNLTQLEKNFDQHTDTSEIIRSIPDLVVVNKKGEPFFVEVKFRKDIPSDNDIDARRIDEKESKRKKLKRAVIYWDSVFILVTNVEPYFRVARSSYFRGDDTDYKIRFMAIEEYKKFDIKPHVLKEFNNLIKITKIGAWDSSKISKGE